MNNRIVLAGIGLLGVSACASGNAHWDVVGNATIMSEPWVTVWSEEVEAGVLPMLPDEQRVHYYASNPSSTKPVCVQVVFEQFEGGGYSHSAMWKLEPNADRLQVAYGQAAFGDNLYISTSTYAWSPGAEGTPVDCSGRPASDYFKR